MSEPTDRGGPEAPARCRSLREPAGDGRQRLGRRGEAAAEAALRRAGLRILLRRFRCRAGEIDLVARDGEVLVFVEVKTRSGTSLGRPAEAVTPGKRARLARVALVFLSRHGLLEAPCRFDVVEVLERPGKPPVVHHITDAFRLWPTG